MKGALRVQEVLPCQTLKGCEQPAATKPLASVQDVSGHLPGRRAPQTLMCRTPHPHRSLLQPVLCWELPTANTVLACPSCTWQEVGPLGLP